MVQSPVFWATLAASVLVFWVLPLRARMPFLAAASFGYLFTLAPTSVTVLLGWTLAFYALAPLSSRDNRRWLGIGLVLGILGYLGFHKYLPPLLDRLAIGDLERHAVLPLGISYFTFKLIHYALEVGRGRIKDRSLGQFLAYIFLFPIFTAGPIERFDHFLANQQPRLRVEDVVVGLTRISHGLIKKFLFAEALVRVAFRGKTASSIIASLDTLDPITAWTFAILTLLYIYFDFSAYSDLAIGASRLFGLTIMENFDRPLLAPNLGTFWKRWHMSLASWCQSYVYLPVIGLTRQPYLAVYATFITMGLWHSGSLNWVMWGAYHATGVAVFQKWSRYKRKRKLKWPKRRVFHYVGVAMTVLFVSSATVFASTSHSGHAVDALRLLSRLLFLPAW